MDFVAHLPVKLLGDLVISVDTAQRQAAERGHGLLDEARVLLVHGLLHLCGYDHERGEAALAEMAAEEQWLMQELGWEGDGLIASVGEWWTLATGNSQEKEYGCCFPITKKVIALQAFSLIVLSRRRILDASLGISLCGARASSALPPDSEVAAPLHAAACFARGGVHNSVAFCTFAGSNVHDSDGEQDGGSSSPPAEARPKPAGESRGRKAKSGRGSSDPPEMPSPSRSVFDLAMEAGPVPVPKKRKAAASASQPPSASSQGASKATQGNASQPAASTAAPKPTTSATTSTGPIPKGKRSVAKSGAKLDRVVAAAPEVAEQAPPNAMGKADIKMVAIDMDGKMLYLAYMSSINAIVPLLLLIPEMHLPCRH